MLVGTGPTSEWQSVMPLALRRSKTATGKAEIIVGNDCGWDDFPKRAREIVRHFRMRVDRRIDGPDCRVWLASLGEATFCISWDDMMCEVSVMAWESTPDTAVDALADGS